MYGVSDTEPGRSEIQQVGLCFSDKISSFVKQKKELLLKKPFSETVTVRVT